MSESNGYQSPFIDDGMEGEFTIEAVPGFWSEAKIRYRPFAAAEESAVFAKAQLFPGVGSAKFFAELFATKILGWDLKKQNGETLPVTAENIGRLNSQFFDILKEHLRQPGEQPKN